MNNFGSSDGGPLGKALSALAILIAALASFYLGPLFHSVSADWVLNFARQNYAFPGVVQYTAWAHALLVWGSIFFAAYAVFSLIFSLTSGKVSLRAMG